MNRRRHHRPRPQWYGLPASGRLKGIIIVGLWAVTKHRPIQGPFGAIPTTIGTPTVGTTTRDTGTAKITNMAMDMRTDMIGTKAMNMVTDTTSYTAGIRSAFASEMPFQGGLLEVASAGTLKIRRRDLRKPVAGRSCALAFYRSILLPLSCQETAQGRDMQHERYADQLPYRSRRNPLLLHRPS
jgi:hypothetical protein